MSQSSTKSLNESKIKPRHYLKPLKESSLALIDLSNHHSSNQYPLNINFEQYLLTEHQQQLSKSQSESLGYRQDRYSKEEDNFSPGSVENQNQNPQKLIESYTFAGDISSYRKLPQNHFIFPEIQSIFSKNDKLAQFSYPSIQNHGQFNLAPYNLTQNSITSSEYQQNQTEHNLSQTLQQSQKINISSLIESQNVIDRICYQNKQIMTLQQKLYYYEDFCKRLLKSNEQKQNLNKKIADQLKRLKSKLKDQHKKIKQLQEALESKEKQVQTLKIKCVESKKSNEENCRCFSKDLLQKQKNLNEQNCRCLSKDQISKQNSIYLNKIQKQKKIIEQKYRILIGNYEKNQNKYIGIQTEVVRARKNNQSLKKKNQNLQNINKILEKEIQQLNIKIFKFQKQMQEITCKAYAFNLTRIKTLAQTGVDLFGQKKALIKEFSSYRGLRTK